MTCVFTHVFICQTEMNKPDFMRVWNSSNVLKGHNRRSQMSQNNPNWKTIETQPVRYVVKYKVRKMAKSLLKNRYCPMLLMRTPKTAVYLQTKAFFTTGRQVPSFFLFFPIFAPKFLFFHSCGIKRIDIGSFALTCRYMLMKKEFRPPQGASILHYKSFKPLLY